MRITAPAGKIASSLALLASAAREHKTKPALGVVRIEAKDGEISFAGTDLDISISASVASEVEVIEPGRAAPAYDRFAALIGGFAGNAVLIISATETGISITPQGSRATYRLPCLAQDTLPVMPAIDTATGEIKLTAPEFLRLLEPVAAVSTEKTRYFLCAVFLQTVGRELIATGADGLKLIRVATAADSFSETRDCVIPSSAITALRGLFTRSKPELVTMQRSLRLFTVITSGFEFTTKLVEAGPTGYPETDRAIPKPAANPLNVSRVDLMAALHRLAAVAVVGDTPLVTLSAGDGQLTIRLSRQPADDGCDHIVADGNLDKIVAPIKPLVGMLGEFNAERVGLEAVSGVSPLVIRETGKLGLIARAQWKDGEMPANAAMV